MWSEPTGPGTGSRAGLTGPVVKMSPPRACNAWSENTVGTELRGRCLTGHRPRTSTRPGEARQQKAAREGGRVQTFPCLSPRADWQL